MSAGALLFLGGSWVAMLGLTGWSFVRILRIDSGGGDGRTGAQPPRPADRRVTE